VNAYTPGYQAHPAVAAAADGSFLVVWESPHQDGDGFGIFGRPFARTGLPRGGDFQINSSMMHSQFGPAVAADAHGGFVVVWTSSTGAHGASAVAGQRLGTDGYPAAAADGGRRFIVTSETRDPAVRFRSDERVVAQHYALAGVCGDNGGDCPRSCAAARAAPLRQRWTGSLRPDSAPR
jgi:hypothetical protein